MAEFDPDAYLAGDTSAPPEAPSSGGFDPDAYLAGGNDGSTSQGHGSVAPARASGPAPEGPLVSGVREFAHSVVPGIVGAAAAPLGAAAGSVVPVAGTFAGGAAAFIGASLATEYAQEKLLHGTSLDDSEQRAANRAANPKSSFAGGLAGGMATMSPVGVGETIGKQVAQRGFGAAAMGGFEAGGEAIQGEEFDPSHIAMAAAAGAVFPGVNKLGHTVQGPAERFLAGRPGRTANPAADQAHADVADTGDVDAAGDVALSESPPRPTGETTGNPGSAPVRSSREYPKDTQAGAEGTQSPPTTGDIAPDTAAALEAANPTSQPAPPVQRPLGMPAQNFRPEPQVARPPEPSVEAGFPQAGEPVATGANDATPMPANMPAKAAAAIAKSKSATATPPPPIKGESAINDSVTEAQKVAGNYPKARTHDFGKPIAIETHAGDVRRGKGPEGDWENVSPYEYGYFNKTMGPDGDHIDFARPKDGSPELGDKHFIIDQKDNASGKYDEPKVFTYYKDKAAAVDAYNRGFSDNKGPDRMHDITEVSRGDLVKFLARHTKTPPRGPFGEAMPKAGPKPVKERAVFKDLLEKKPEQAEALMNAPDKDVAAAIEGKRTRKYGVGTGASAGYPVEGILNAEGKPVTANTKAKATERASAHKAVSDWYEKSAPPAGEETNGALLDRLKGVPDQSGWVPSHKPKEWLLAREAKRVLAKPAPKMIENYRTAERQLRGGDEAVDTYRGGNRIEADIAKSNRSGDEAIAGAEAKLHNPGVNSEEDAILESIDRARAGKGKFDVPHEEAESMVTPTLIKGKGDLTELPRRTVDAADRELSKIDLKKVSDTAAAKRQTDLRLAKEARDKSDEKLARSREAFSLTSRESQPALRASEDKKAGAGKKIVITDPEKLKALIELSNKAAKRGGLSEEEIAQHDLTKQSSVKPQDTKSVKRLFEQFAADERGSLNFGQIKADFKKMMETTPVKSYIARTPNPKLEPYADYTRGLSDDLHKVAQADKSHRLDLIEKMRSLPKEADQAALERIYKAREADTAQLPLPAGKASHLDMLSPADRKIYDDHLKPIFDENDQFFDAISAMDPDRLGPKVDSHIARITKGDTSEYNMLKDRDDPTGPNYNGLSVNATMAHERPFTALERVSDGKRFVVQNRDNGFSLHQNYKASKVVDPNYAFEANQPYTYTGKANKNAVDYIMRHATAAEIAANARGRDGKGKPMRYYQNAALSAMMTNAQMGSMARHLAELARISSTPEFTKLTTRNAESANKKGYIKTLLPNFEGTYMDPQLAHVMDDYAKPGFNGPQMLRDLNQGVTKLLFWMPTAHIANVGAHWFVGRGFDNLNAKALFETGAKAIKSVMTQDAYQKALRDNGAGTIYPSVLTRQFIEQIAKGVGEQFEKDPGRFGPMADKLGVPLGKLKDAIYTTSSKVMWAANDMFLTQRVMELERKGHSMDQAIKMAERDIPNYRVPTTIMGSGQKGRILSQLVQDPTLLAFGRYHYGMWNSYANIVKDAVGKDASAGDRIDAVGKMMAMGVLGMVIYPMMDKFAQLVTGNDHATQQRRGPLAVPSHLRDAAEGKEDIMGAARSTFTLQPLVSTVLETLFNKDFRGKPIVEPGDVRAAAHGDVKAGGRAALQEGEHALRGLVSPYSTFANASKKDVSPAGAVRDQALDVKNPSAGAIKFANKAGINTFRDANSRFKKGGSGPLEGAYDKAFGR